MNATLAAIFLSLALLALIFVVANVAIGYERAKKQDVNCFRLNEWGLQQLRTQRYLRGIGQEPSLMDLRHISEKVWQPFTNVIPLG